MPIDSKGVNLVSSEEGAEQRVSQVADDAEVSAHAAATATRVALYFSVLVFSAACGYGYLSVVLYGKDSLPSGVVGFTIACLAFLETSLADYADRLPIPYVAEETSVLYGFFVSGGLATTGSLLLHESQVAVLTIPALHWVAVLTTFTVILGVAIFLRQIERGREKLVDAMETSW